jgi:hypothetical protein
MKVIKAAIDAERKLVGVLLVGTALMAMAALEPHR